MAYEVEGDDVNYETIENKVIIYLKKGHFNYTESCKCFGTHYLEQTLDDNDNVINETIKENPHWVDLDEIIDKTAHIKGD